MIVRQGVVDTHPEMIAAALQRFRGQLAKVGLESGPFTPHLHRSLAAQDFPMVCMDARRTADAIKARRIKTLLGARDQPVKIKRSLGNQVRGLLRPFGIRGADRADPAQPAVPAGSASGIAQ